MQRSEFLKGILGIATAAALPPILAEDAPRRIGMSTVEECRAAVSRLYTMDTSRGSADLLTVAQWMTERMRYLLDRATYSVETGRALHQITGASTENVGWVAFDSGQHDLARRWWLEALHTADLADDQDTRVIVLLSMSLQAQERGQGTDSLRLAEAARQAVPHATPRLASLTAARTGLAHARLGDRAAVEKSFGVARSYLDQGAAEGDPDWTSFWGLADLASHETRAWRYLGSTERAIRAARQSVSAADPGMPRNLALYKLDLAAMLAQYGDAQEAIDNVRPLIGSRMFTSNRVSRLTTETVQSISQRGQQAATSPTGHGGCPHEHEAGFTRR